jgi:glutathione S-transferase
MSAFAARCRVTILEKQLPIEILPPPGGLQSDEFAAITPLRRVPILQLDDGRVIVESDVILEYLDDVFPDRPQRPSNVEDLAQMRAVMRIVDNYIAQQLGGLFLKSEPGSEAAEDYWKQYRQGLEHLVHAMAPRGHATADMMTLADATVSTMLFIAYAALGALDRVAYDGIERLEGYMGFIAKQPSVRAVLREQAAGLPPPLYPHGERFFDRYPA